MRCFLGFVSFSLLVGCTGFSLGENNPSGNLGTSLGGGKIAVDPVTETAYVLVTEEDKDAGITRKQLMAVKAEADRAEHVLTLDDREDPRMLFTDNGVLVMSQREGGESLTMFDRESFAVIGQKDVPVWYWGARQSASRRWIGVVDNESDGHDIHVIDAHTFETRAIPHGGDWLEAMFTNRTDRLLSITFDQREERARILSWSMSDLEASGFQTKSATAPWEGAELDLAIDGVVADRWFSHTWVGISPNDHYAVFPVRKAAAVSSFGDTAIENYELLVTDLQTGEVRVVPEAKGPVGFTPDGSTIVSYGEDAQGNSELLLIDAETLAIEHQDMPGQGAISYFVSHKGNYVVVSTDTQSMVLVDIDEGGQTVMSGPDAGLDEFVVRDRKAQAPSAKAPTQAKRPAIDTDEQLYIVQTELDDRLEEVGGTLFLADLARAEVSEIALPFEPVHVGILRKNDQIVLGDVDRHALHFVDPKTNKVLRDVPLGL